MEVPRNIFLDAAVFVEANFNYSSKRFGDIASFGARGLIQILLTDITVREIRAKLEEAVKHAFPTVKPNSILKNSTLPEITKRRDPIAQKAVEKELLEELLDQFEQFAKDANVKILKFEAEGILEVFDDYFDLKPPFGIGKNKAEFPDACALNALRKWCKAENDALAVVTRDNGVAAACITSDWFHHFKDLAEYLDTIATDDETKADDSVTYRDDQT